MTSNYFSKLIIYNGFMLDQEQVLVQDLGNRYKFICADFNNLEYWNLTWAIHNEVDYVVHNTMTVGSRSIRLPESVSRQIAEISAPHAVMAKLVS